MKNKFDKEIEDLGWEKMQTLLDKEKPTVGVVPPQYIDQKLAKNGSSRKRWALAALLFLSLAGCGIWSYYFFKIKTVNDQAIELNNTCANENNEQNLTQNRLNTDERDTRHEAPPQGVKDDLSRQLNSQNSNLSEPNKLENLIENKENKGILTENKDEIINEKLTNEPNVIDAENMVDNTRNNEDKFVEINASDNVDKIGERLPFEVLNLLILEPIIDTVSSINQKANLIINLKENTSKMLQKWQFGLTLGIHTEGVKLLDGYQMGLVLRRNLTQKWVFSTGLNYRKTSTKSRQNASFLTADKANASSSVTTPYSGFDLSKVVEVRLNDLKYLELPVMFNHLVNRRLSVFGGVKMSYLLSKNWINIDTSNANLYVITYRNQSNKISNSSSKAYDVLSSNSVNNAIDFAVLGGIHYRISRHFDASVRYDFGLKNILKQNNAAVYNRYLGMNVNYYF